VTVPFLANIRRKPPRMTAKMACIGDSLKRIAGSLGRVDRLGDYAFKSKLAGVLQDEFAVADLMAVN
jgi:hypothetical protein